MTDLSGYNADAPPGAWQRMGWFHPKEGTHTTFPSIGHDPYFPFIIITGHDEETADEYTPDPGPLLPTWELVPFPIYSVIRELIELVPDTEILPGTGSLHSDLEALYFAAKLGSHDPVIPVPTEINVVGFKLGVMYRDLDGREVTWTGFLVKLLFVVVLLKVLPMVFPYIPYASIVAVVMKYKPKDETVDIINKKLGSFEIEEGQTVSSQLARLLGSSPQSTDPDVVNLLNQILSLVGKVRFL